MKFFWILLALLYTLSPLDVLPDFLPGGGWIDDAVVWILVLRHLFRQTERADAKRQYRRRRTSPDPDAAGPQKPSPSGEDPRSPHAVLGVGPDASPEEIKAAYRDLANRYHPDKVAHLGEEFQNLAESRFKEIQAAYRELTRQTP